MAMAASRLPPDLQSSDLQHVDSIVTETSHASGRSSESSSSRPQKRRRRSSENEDIENVMPPTKRASIAYTHDRPGSVGSVGSVGSDRSSTSPHYSGVSSTENFECPSVLAESSCSEESSPGRLSDVTHGVLCPLDNLNKGASRKKVDKRIGADGRTCPLPPLPWADPQDVWERLCERDVFSASQRSAKMLTYHPSLKIRMRSILLDWLIEVSAVHRLQRETFHLCVYYLDRYLSITINVHKNHLQLLGITCLFIAAKLTEIYPPKIADFAYVTDGACTQEDIINEEAVILTALDWKITSMTANGWLNLYLQLSNDKFSKRSLDRNREDVDGLGNYTFLFTQYSSLDFVTCAQLIDLAMFDVGINNHKYSHVAAAAIAHRIDRDLAVRVSGCTWEELERCYLWMTPFARVLSECDDAEHNHIMPNLENINSSSDGLSKICPDINPESYHRIQVRNVTLALYDKVEDYIKVTESCNESGSSTDNEDVRKSFPMTPPDSSHKKTHAKKTYESTEICDTRQLSPTQ